MPCVRAVRRARFSRSSFQTLHHQTVIYSLGESAHWIFTQGSRQQPVVPHGRLRVSSSEGIRAGVLTHQGLAMTAEWMFMPELARGEVKTVLNDWKLPPRELWAVTPTGRMASAKARAFISHVERILNDLPSTIHLF
ncbi:LysR substrate-binding domain-containing protein [Pseudomonas sp. MDT1-85]